MKGLLSCPDIARMLRDPVHAEEWRRKGIALRQKKALAAGVKPAAGIYGHCPRCPEKRYGRSLSGGLRECRECGALWDARIDERPDT